MTTATGVGANFPERYSHQTVCHIITVTKLSQFRVYASYEGWNFNSGNYLFTTDTK